MAERVSITDAKVNFSAAVRRAESGETVVITRHGNPVAALIDADELEQLERLRSAGPDAGLAGLTGGWEGSDELVERIAESPRTGSRDTPVLD